VVRDVSVTRDGDALEIAVVTQGDANIELYTADARKALLENALGTTITFREVSRDGNSTEPP
jgi:hypothetical protein